LIDTPGHVDFQYEVSRSLAAVEGAVLLVDATQGIQAQTLSTLYMAMHHNIVIIPVINKIDLPAADVPRVTREIQQVIWIDPSEIIAISAKTGEWVDHVLDAVIERISAPDDFWRCTLRDIEKMAIYRTVPPIRGALWSSIASLIPTKEWSLSSRWSMVVLA
jgi:translation elongation factor EF-4